MTRRSRITDASGARRTSDGPCSDSSLPAASERHPTCDHILACAKRVLIEHGYARFTTRLVAEAAGISPGNLSYHFPSKAELLRAMVGQLVDEYACQFADLLSESSIAPKRQLEFLVQWLLTDAVATESARIFRELWAMSLHDEVVRRSVDDLYGVLMDRVAQLLHRSHPKADIRSIRELVQMLALVSEGSIVLYGTMRHRDVSLERIIELLPPLLRAIAPNVRT